MISQLRDELFIISLRCAVEHPVLDYKNGMTGDLFVDLGVHIVEWREDSNISGQR